MRSRIRYHIENASIATIVSMVFGSLLTMMLLAMIFPSTLEGLGLTRSSSSSLSSEVVRVAFVGNSFQFVNDLPRFMEQLVSFGNDNGRYNHRKTKTIEFRQDSMLHGALSLESLLTKGNGMYYRWNTTNARIGNVRSTNANSYMKYDDDGNDDGKGKNDDDLYDFGACTVTQLFLGYDENLVENNENEYYTNDGLNPCMQNEDYFNYRQQSYGQGRLSSSPLAWDYVVLNDQSMKPALLNKRYNTIDVLQNYYAPLLVESGATPVLYSTYGYWRTDINMTEKFRRDQSSSKSDGASVEDVPTFASRLHRGYELYARALEESMIKYESSRNTNNGSRRNLKKKRNPSRVRIAPVGLVFLTVWEENHNLWQKLFFDGDLYHPSPLGTYIIGCTIYSTIFEQLPPAVTDDDSTATTIGVDDGTQQPRSTMSTLFSKARSMQLYGDDLPLPSVDEALYARHLVKRVVFDKHVPKSLKLYSNDEQEFHDDLINY